MFKHRAQIGPSRQHVDTVQSSQRSTFYDVPAYQYVSVEINSTGRRSISVFQRLLTCLQYYQPGTIANIRPHDAQQPGSAYEVREDAVVNIGGQLGKHRRSDLHWLNVTDDLNSSSRRMRVWSQAGRTTTVMSGRSDDTIDDETVALP